MRHINIEGKQLSQTSRTYFIADIAANHDGDLSRAKDLIYKAAEAGADAAKFQHFTANTIVSDEGFKRLGSQLGHQSTWKKSVFEVYEDASVDLGWTPELVETCKKAGITFFTTPYSLDIVEYIDKFVPAYKIGSGDITWPEIIKKVARTNKPYMLATGASSMDDVIQAVDLGLSINEQLVLMQCNTNYTGSLENFKYLNLNVLNCYKYMYPEVILGLSDHTPGHSSVLGAVALGARVIEKHFTDDNQREGPDHAFSMSPESWNEMVHRTRELELALGTGIKKIEPNEIETSVVQRRALRAKRNLVAGSRICSDDFEALRPCPDGAYNPSEISLIEGKYLSFDIKEGNCIYPSSLVEQ